MVSALAIMGAAIGGYFGVKSYVDILEGNEEEISGEMPTPVFSAETSEITSLKFMIDKTEVIFEKQDDKWTKKDEPAFPVNQDKLSEAVSSICSLEADRVLEDVSDLGEYELDSPQNTIFAATQEGDTVLQIGLLNTSTDQYYVNINDEKNTVYVIDSAAFDPFMVVSLYDFAQGEDFPSIDASLVSSVSVEQGNSIYELKMGDSGLWEVSNGENTEKADSARAASLPSYLAALSYNSFVDYDSTDDSAYGLEKPYAIITADYDDNSLVLYVGNQAEGNSRYVKLKDSNEIYTMSEDALSSFIDKSIADFWDLTVSYISVNNLDSLQIKMENEEHKITVLRETKGDEEGEITEILSYELDGDELEDTLLFTAFYNKVINMSAQERLTDKYEPEISPELEIIFETVNKDTVNVEYYEYDDNYYAAVTEGKVFLINKINVRDLKDAYNEMIE